MPRRNEQRFQQPSVPTYDEAKPRPPKPVVYTDKNGREWLCEYLRLGEGYFGKTDNLTDARHRGFAFARHGEVHQRVYRFQLGDDRSTERETIYRQLALSKKVPGHARACREDASGATEAANSASGDSRSGWNLPALSASLFGSRPF